MDAQQLTLFCLIYFVQLQPKETYRSMGWRRICRHTNNVPPQILSSSIWFFRLQARIEGMEPLLDGFNTAVMVFRVKGHNLLDYHSNRFDRDFVDFNVRYLEFTFYCTGGTV